jgi:phospholipid/cholesterol/gamma-HCH transport system substrate-binding protein
MGRSLAGTLEGLDAAGARLGRGDNTLGRLLTERELYDRLQTMTARVDQVVAGLDEGRGSAGQLLRDRELYDNMNRAASELRALLSDIRKDPKKYLRVSVSIF